MNTKMRKQYFIIGILSFLIIFFGVVQCAVQSDNEIRVIRTDDPLYQQSDSDLPKKLSDLYNWEPSDINELYYSTLDCDELKRRFTSIFGQVSAEIPEDVVPLMETCDKISDIRDEVRERNREKNFEEMKNRMQEQMKKIEDDINGAQ